MSARLQVPPTAAQTRTSSWRRARQLREALAGYAFLAPAGILLLTFTLLPGLYAIYVSLQDTNLLGGKSKFIGLGNYITLLHSSDFWHSVWVTAYFAVGTVPTGIALALGLALALNARIRGRALFRVGILAPYVTPVVATSIIWLWVFNPNYGLANYVLGLFHLPPLGWLQDTRWAMPALIIYTLWHDLGFAVVIFLGGLTTIPAELREAARIDGASPWREFWSITWPLLTPTTFFVLVIATINAFKVFTQVYTLTPEGGPEQATAITGFYVYQQAFAYLHIGYASAVSVVIFFMVFLLTLLQMGLANRFVFYR